MGWTIQHLDGYSRSGRQITNLMEHAEQNLTVDEFRALSPIVNCDGHNPFVFTARQAADARDVLDTLADRLRWSWSREARDGGKFARDIATAADTAARSGKPWRWN